MFFVNGLFKVEMHMLFCVAHNLLDTMNTHSNGDSTSSQ